MTKPKPKLAPRDAPDRVALDAYLKGQTPQGPEQSPRHLAQEPDEAGRKVFHRKDGRARVRTTIYFDPDLARALAVRAAETGADQSEIVGAALASYLRRI